MRKVYFIGSPGHPIKIGVSDDPLKRLRQLQIGCPQPLFLLATADGEEKDERRLHAIFRKARLRGEWFRATPELMMLIWHLAAQGKNAILPTFWFAADESLEAVEKIVRTSGPRGIAQVLRDKGLSGRKAKELAGALAAASRDVASPDSSTLLKAS